MAMVTTVVALPPAPGRMLFVPSWSIGRCSLYSGITHSHLVVEGGKMGQRNTGMDMPNRMLICQICDAIFSVLDMFGIRNMCVIAIL